MNWNDYSYFVENEIKKGNKKLPEMKDIFQYGVSEIETPIEKDFTLPYFGRCYNIFDVNGFRFCPFISEIDEDYLIIDYFKTSIGNIEDNKIFEIAMDVAVLNLPPIKIPRELRRENREKVKTLWGFRITHRGNKTNYSASDKEVEIKQREMSDILSKFSDSKKILMDNEFFTIYKYTKIESGVYKYSDVEEGIGAKDNTTWRIYQETLEIREMYEYKIHFKVNTCEQIKKLYEKHFEVE